MTVLFKEFQEFRKILCICPCCNDLVRLSDLHLKTKGTVVKTWLDTFEKEVLTFDKKREKFGEKEYELREAAKERGRNAAEKAVNKIIPPALKSLKLDPFDITAILNPIDFVVFKGMTKNDSVEEIIMLSKQVKNKSLNNIRQQVKNSILKKKYEWQVARIDEKGQINFE